MKKMMRMKLKRGQNKKYILRETFTALVKAIEYVDSQKIWRRSCITNSKTSGKKHFYNCNLTLKRGKQCSTGLYILRVFFTINL